MSLPNADRALVDLVKLSDYCLSATHPVGRHKAAVFRSALGLTTDDAPRLSTLILEAAQLPPAIEGRKDEHAPTLSGRFPGDGGEGTAVVRTAWIVRADEDIPRLVTCYTP